LNWIPTIFLTLTLLLACLVILLENRLCVALQQVLKHIINHWRPCVRERKTLALMMLMVQAMA
tara:strand:+ start:2705 stop:2893 length:189 start_codon:yes stop_codon:yes gene_type:complete